MTTEQQNLPAELMQMALCKTDHPGRAASALVAAAGAILHIRAGIGAFGVLRAIIDDAEAAIIRQHGKQPGETAQ